MGAEKNIIIESLKKLFSECYIPEKGSIEFVKGAEHPDRYKTHLPKID